MEKNYNKLIMQVVGLLKENKTIIYPTDTVWGLGCDATNENAVISIYKIKQREESKSVIVLVSSIEMLEDYVGNVSKELEEFIMKQSRPTTIIYNNPKNLAKNTIAKDGTIAIRLVNNGFAHELIKAFGKPIVSTSANISGKITPKDFNSISKDILKNVDFIVNLPSKSNNSKASKIVRFNQNKIEIIRD